MKLKDLFRLFNGINVEICGTPTNWDSISGYVDLYDYDEEFVPFLNCNVVEMEIDTCYSGTYCGQPIEKPYLDITIK